VVLVECDRLADGRVRLHQGERQGRGDHVDGAVALGEPEEQRQGENDIAEVCGLNDKGWLMGPSHEGPS
jgi:hypothetical protein